MRQTPKYDNKDYKGYSDTIPVARMTDSLLHAGETIDYNGKKVTYAPFKMAIFTGCNQWHRHSERNKMKQAFQNWKPLFRSTTVGRQPAASPTSCCRPVPHLNATILTPTAHTATVA